MIINHHTLLDLCYEIFLIEPCLQVVDASTVVSTSKSKKKRKKKKNIRAATNNPLGIIKSQAPFLPKHQIFLGAMAAGVVSSSPQQQGTPSVASKQPCSQVKLN